MRLVKDSIIASLIVIIIQVSDLKSQDDLLNTGEVYTVAENGESFQNTTNCSYFTVDRVKSEVKCGAKCWKLGQCAAFQFSDANTRCILCVENVSQVSNTPGLVEFDGSFSKDDKIWKDKCKSKIFGPFGGVGGGEFSDINSYKSGGRISSLHACHDSTNNKLQGLWMTYGNVEGTKHGVTTGTCVDFTMNNLEFVTGMNGTIDILTFHGVDYDFISQITFHTNQNRKFGPVGLSTSKKFSYTSHQPLGFITGKSGGAVDRLNFHVICEN